MSSFYKRSLIREQYYVESIKPVLLSGTTVTPISPSRPKLTQPVAASEFIRQKTVVGISNNVFDANLQDQDPNIDLGVLYSNGTRLQYLDFRATTGVCDVVVKDKFITVVDDSNGITYDQFLSGYTLTSAYSGSNAVIPVRLPSDIDNSGPRPPVKVPFIQSKINC
jgi:hypothetical protein